MSRVAIVTGGAGALGRAIADRLARDGMVVVAADLPGAERHPTDAGARIAPADVDVTDAGSIERLVAETRAAHGGLHVVVNCAGVLDRTPLRAMEAGAWDRSMAVNVRGPMLLTRAALPAWEAQGPGGSVINIASRTWLSGGPPAYVASKAALVGLTRALARELGPLGVTANAVAPSFVPTPMTEDGRSGDEVEALADRFRAITPLNRLGSGGEVADVVAFLASDAARFITGEAISVAGGAQLAAVP